MALVSLLIINQPSPTIEHILFVISCAPNHKPSIYLTSHHILGEHILSFGKLLLTLRRIPHRKCHIGMHIIRTTTEGLKKEGFTILFTHRSPCETRDESISQITPRSRKGQEAPENIMTLLKSTFLHAYRTRRAPSNYHAFDAVSSIPSAYQPLRPLAFTLYSPSPPYHTALT